MKAREVDCKPPKYCVAALADLKAGKGMDGIHSLAFLLALEKPPVLTPLWKLCSLSSGS